MPVDLVEPASSPSTWTGSVCATPPTCTPEGFRHFSFVKDISRDWSLAGHAATHLRTDLGLDALKMAVAPRPPAAGELVEITRVTRASTPSHSTRGHADLSIVASVADANDTQLLISFLAAVGVWSARDHGLAGVGRGACGEDWQEGAIRSGG
jgi:hypothetical protein